MSVLERNDTMVNKEVRQDIIESINGVRKDLPEGETEGTTDDHTDRL